MEPVESSVRDVPSLKELFARHRRLALSVFAGVAVPLILVAFVRSEYYTAKAQILVREDADSSLAAVSADTHVELMLAPSHMRLVHECLLPDSQLPDAVMLPDGMRTEAARVEFNRVCSSLDQLAAGEVPTVAELLENVNVFKERHSSVVAVTYVSSKPEIAARITNKLALLYVTQFLNEAFVKENEAEQQFNERLRVARAELEQQKNALRRHIAEWGLGNVERVEQMEVELAGLRQQIAADTSRLQSDAVALNEANGPAENVTDSGTMEFGGARSLPDRDALTSRIEAAKRRMEILESARAELRGPLLRLSQLERNVAAADRVYDGLLQNKVARLARDRNEAAVRIVSLADVPEEPSSPSTIIFLIPSLALAGLAAVVSVAAADRLDRRLRDARTIEDSLGVHCVGVLPHPGVELPLPMRLQSIVDEPFEPYAQSARSMAGYLTENLERPIIAVTSLEKGPGAETAGAVAVAAAQRGMRTLVLDLDMPVLGFSEMIADPEDRHRVEDFDEAWTAYNFPKLSVTVGQMRARAAATLFSDEQFLKTTLARFQEDFECIVLRLGSPLRWFEARSFAAEADRVVLAFGFARHEIDEAKGVVAEIVQLAGGDSSLIDVVLTNVEEEPRALGLSA